MEPETDRAAANDKREEPEDDKAMKQSPVPGETLPPRRALRERGVGRQRTGAASASDSADTNGATSGSGRVLRDRSTRTIPAWLQSDQSDEDGEEEAIAEPGANRRRKVACPRRKKNASSTASTENTGEEVGDGSSCQDPDQPKKATEAQALPTRRTAARAKGPLARASRGAAKAACKNEPDMDSSTVDAEAKITGKSTAGSEKKEEEAEEDEAMLEDEEEDASFRDDPKDLNYRPQTQRDMEDEELSSDEDVPFTDDLNDQSYNPRDAPKSRRRAPPRQREKKEKVQVAEREEEPRIKVEGGGGGGAESVQEVKLESELGDASQEPRIPRRGRRRKDDKTPRLPKRRKKPPVQYVRCEMEGCGTVLAHPRYLQHHIKYQHLLMKKYVCPHPSCGRLFRLQKQLLRHAKHHTDQRDYICEFCARAFKSSHNLAVHRMIHTGEKPLQCEICGFTCRQKASLNWHMKKHDADASYQFSCSICGKKFEKKDSVVAHKAKSHPEVLIAEALAANAGALITTTPASLMEAVGNPAQGAELTRQAAEPARQAAQVSQAAQGGPAGPPVTQAGSVAQQLGQVSQQVVVMGQDPGLHDVQVPVTIALSSMDSPSPTDALQTHLQMPLQFVQTSPALPSRQQQQQVQQLTLQTSSIVTQHQLQHQTQLQHLQLQSYQQQQQQQTQTQILHMTFQPVSQSQTHIQQIPILATPQQLQTLTTSQQIQTLATPQQLQTLATPQQLQTLATPQQIQTLATPQQLETLATPQQLQTLATTQQLQTLATTQQLQTLATPQQLQTLATPQQLQTLATPQQLQTLATPQQFQTLTTSQQLQTLATPQQIQTLAAPQQLQTLATPQQLQTLATPQQLQTHQALPHTSATLGPRLLSQSQDHTSNDGESYVLDGSALVSSASPSLGALQSEETMDEVGGVWEQGEETVVLTEGTEGHMQHTLI